MMMMMTGLFGGRHTGVPFCRCRRPEPQQTGRQSSFCRLL